MRYVGDTRRFASFDQSNEKTFMLSVSWHRCLELNLLGFLLIFEANLCLSPVAVTSPSDFASASSKEFLDIQAIIECGFTLKRVRDMTRTYSVVLLHATWTS